MAYGIPWEFPVKLLLKVKSKSLPLTPSYWVYHSHWLPFLSWKNLKTSSWMAFIMTLTFNFSWARLVKKLIFKSLPTIFRTTEGYDSQLGFNTRNGGRKVFPRSGYGKLRQMLDSMETTVFASSNISFNRTIHSGHLYDALLCWSSPTLWL